VDVITAGFPCQDISFAGRGAGLKEGTRSSAWNHVMAAVRVLRPGLVVVENVAALCYPGRGMGAVLGDLAAAGYDAAWRRLRAADIGAPHPRPRVFIAAAADPAGPRPSRRAAP
jgi:DNA (cytosine-5)-methyltransferase 1